MTDLEQRKAAKEFAEYWKDRGNEKSESQKFWISLLTEVFGVKDIKNFIYFEERVDKLMDGNTGWVDVTIPSTKVLIEQKSSNVELDKKIKHGDVEINAFQQAWLYNASLNYDEKSRWIVTCNFKSFRIYDMNNRNSEPEEILLKDLPKEYYRLSFLVDSKNEHIKKEEEVSFKAGEIVGVLYDAFSKQYNDLSQESSQKSLNELCVRLVFCLYAEDAGLFGRKNVFHDYLAKYDDLDQMRKALIELFKVLDTPTTERDPYLEDDLNQFPYVNGGLFSNENIEIPRFTQEIRETLLAKASDDFDWSDISPTIFGAVFESTLNPETRRAGGMHYTSVENIHKVIDPLFLDELRKELDDALAYKNEKTRNEALDIFQNHVGSLTFFDPACGSGNFLTETYLSLRRMENEAIAAKQHGMIALDFGDVVKVHINQFYGIEVNDFAVKVATTALWIAESQMLQETEKLLSRHLKFLPLKTYTNIVEGNALRMDWNEVIPNTQCNYIMGNPPFVGHQWRTESQIEDMDIAFSDLKIHGKLDYVCAWYNIAANYMKDTYIKCGFVSTNSICQGESVNVLWSHLFKKGVEIQYAYRSFKWDSEASIKAAVFVVIIGFVCYKTKEDKKLYDGDTNFKIVKNINGYLVNYDNIFVEARGKCKTDGIPNIIKGSQPTDGGFLILSPEEKEEFDKTYKNISFIKEFMGADEFINGKKRYCIWLKDVSPTEYRNNAFVMDRLKKVSEFRLTSKTESVRKAAETPTLFTQIRQPNSDYLIIPKVSTSSRRYIPIGFMNKEVICSDLVMMVPNSNLYHFGVLTSNVHMAWMRAVCGRLGNGYRYSVGMVYNNFPWPNPTKEQKEKIEKTAQLILDARKKYQDASLSDLYDVVAMPPELRKAHYLNDMAVWEAYGKKWSIKSESDCVAYLMKMYQELIDKEQ